MSSFIPWNSQPLEAWSQKHAPGEIIKLEGLDTHYVERGSGNPLILIHGFFFDHNMWSKNIDELSKHFKVYALDLWGYGYSTRTPLDYGYPLYAQQLRLFMDALGIQSSLLAGQSMGAGTIIQFSTQDPDRVDGIILVDAAGLPNPLPIMGKLVNLPALGEAMYSMNNNAIRRLTLGNTFLHRKELITDNYFKRVMRFQKIKGTNDVLLKTTRKQFFDTLSGEIHRLKELDIPTLIIWGREDRAIPVETGIIWHEILNGSDMEILESAGHCPQIDQPELFNKRVLEFLSQS